jgi:hypothetical protein
VDTQIALASARAEPGRVQLTWYGNSAAGMDVTVYRRTLSEDWAARSIERVDGGGQLVYVDVSARAGTRYGYRLGLTPPEGPALIAGEVWVSVPDAFQLGIHGARPNPVERDLVVAFALRDQQPAELELFDLGGRRRWSRRVDFLGPGSHVLACGRIGQITPGVYLLRLTQGETSVAVRVAFVR